MQTKWLVSIWNAVLSWNGLRDQEEMCTQKIIDGTATKSRYLIKAWCGYSVYNHKTITQCHYIFLLSIQTIFAKCLIKESKLHLIFSRDHYQRFLPLQACDKEKQPPEVFCKKAGLKNLATFIGQYLWTRFGTMDNVRSNFVEWSCAAVITLAPNCHNYCLYY